MLSESQNMEFKESWRDEYLKWICGFANAQGGKMYIGINDDGVIVGLPDAERLMEEIPNKIVNYLGIVADVNLLESDAKRYIEIIVQSSNMPIAYKGSYHYRSGSTKQELKGVALQEFIMKKMGHSWDDIPVIGASIDDIDRRAIDFFLRSSIKAGRMNEEELNSSTQDVLQNLGLISPSGELKSAAILLFGKHVIQFFPAAGFKIGRFHNNEADLITQDLVEGNIIQMTNCVIELLRSKYLISTISYEGMQRVETLEIPEVALREILYNAISHKDYNGPAIQMRVYDDTIELWNYGILPEELKAEGLMQRHSSYPRNRNIATTFYKAGFVESWGRGIKKICEEFEAAGLEVPKIEEQGGGVTVIIKRKIFREVTGRQISNVGVNVGVNRFKPTKNQAFMLKLMKSNPSTTAEQMSVQMSVTKRSVERNLKVLQEAGFIRHEGSDKKGFWVVLESKN